MNLRWSRLVLVIGLFFASCSHKNKFDEKFYSAENKSSWDEYAVKLGVGGNKIKGSVFIFANSTACSPCINEIKTWDSIRDVDEIDVFLVIIDKYRANYQSFLSKLDVQLPAFQDSTGFIFEKDLIPFPPVKIFFDKQGDIKMIHPVGAGGELDYFLSQIKKIQV